MQYALSMALASVKGANWTLEKVFDADVKETMGLASEVSQYRCGTIS